MFDKLKTKPFKKQLAIFSIEIDNDDVVSAKVIFDPPLVPILIYNRLSIHEQHLQSVASNIATKIIDFVREGGDIC